MFAQADLSNPDSNGSYSLARQGGTYMYSITEMMRTTGDPRALDELLFWMRQSRELLQDHDGRGYDYVEYTARRLGAAVDGRHNLDDTNWLDETMFASNYAFFAYVLHQNRDVLPAAGEEADEWFTYFDENFLPKWLYRSTIGTDNQYTPPARLGLENAVNWDGGVGVNGDGRGDNASDVALWAGPNYREGDGELRFNQFDGIEHKFPAHHFGHPYLMTIGFYEFMGRYFDETGKQPVSAYISGSTDDFFDEVDTRLRWWNRTVTPQNDGSIDFWLRQHRSNSGLRTDAYSQQIAAYLNMFHWQGIGDFASDATMRAYAKAWYNGDAPNATHVYSPNNVATMARFSDGSGGQIAYRLSMAAYMACWDDSSVLSDLVDQTIISPNSHWILGNQETMSTFWHDSNHFAAILSCETAR